jgi:drug/metabolite transporter (DMT)-like permease
MRRSLVRRFYWGGLALIVVGVGVLLLSLAGGVTTTVNNLGQATTTPNNTPLYIAGSAICVVGALAVVVAWIGALIRTAQLGRWGWFVLLLVFHGLMLLVYVIAGPDQSAQPAALPAESRPQV